MPLPPGRARAFEAAGKRAGICGGKAANDSPVSAADRAYMELPVPFLLRAEFEVLTKSPKGSEKNGIIGGEK